MATPLPPQSISTQSVRASRHAHDCRALTLAAQDGLLKEGFFFIPSLGGPATIEQQLSGEGLSWLVPFVNGAPPIGWEDTAKYLVLPVLLVASQYASLQISAPPNSDDPSVQQTQAILKYLPILIGTPPPPLSAASSVDASVDCPSSGVCAHQRTPGVGM